MLNFAELNDLNTYMHRCLQLAQKGLGKVSPNPMVGAVLVYEGKVIGEGFHEFHGGPHAEVNCIENVSAEQKINIPQSTLFVSLEPCNHHGKTPPCTDLIIKNGIQKVVVACKDPFEKVNGTGIEKLKATGIEVIVGVLEKEAIELNKRFFTYRQQKRPYIILKWAQSKDRFIALDNSSNFKISNAYSNQLVHQWRSEEAAILVGTHTAIKDNPQLTTRLVKGKNPLRICIDKNLQLPQNSNLLDQSAPTIIFNFLEEKTEGINEYIKLDSSLDFISQLLEKLYKKGVSSLIVEGGAKLLNTFIQTNTWDEARIITNTNLELSNGIQAPSIVNAEIKERFQLVGDEVFFMINKQRD